MNGPLPQINMSNKLISAKKHMSVYNPLMHKLFTMICIHTIRTHPSLSLWNSAAKFSRIVSYSFTTARIRIPLTSN